MAILHLQNDRRVPVRRWLALSAAAVAIGAALGAYRTSVTREPGVPAAVASAAQAGCCEEVQTRPMHTQVPQGMPATPASPVREPTPRGDDAMPPAAAYALARQYSDCLVLRKLDEQGALAQREELFERDPTGALAAAQDRADRAQREPCLRVGPGEVRKIDALMRDAALGGNVDAQFFLLNQNVRAEVERIERAVNEGGMVDPDAPATLMRGVQAMARTGHRPAMELALDLANSETSGFADPVLAAAWRLVLLQMDVGELPTDADLAHQGVLFGLDAQEVDRAKREAAQLRTACCRAVDFHREVTH